MKYVFLMLGLFSVGCARINLVATQPPVLQLEDIHFLGATRVEFDATGKRFATGGHLGEIIIWQVPDGNKLVELKHHNKRVRGFIWIDDNTLVSASQDGSIVVWDLANGSKQKVINGSPVSAMVYLRKKRQILTGHEDGIVRLWQYPALNPVADYKLGGSILSVAISHDEKQIAVSSNEADVQLLGTELKLKHSLPAANKNAQELRFSPDDKQLAAGTWFDLHFWDLQTGKLTIEKTEHMGAIISIDYTPDGKHLVSLGRHTDAGIRLRNLQTNLLERRLRTHDLCGYLIRISPDGRYVASASEDASVRLYDISAPYQTNWGH